MHDIDRTQAAAAASAARTRRGALTWATATACVAALACAALAAPAGSQPIEPIEPDPTPSPTYDQRWAPLLADPEFRAIMAVAGEVQSRTTMDGIRELVAGLPKRAASAREGEDAAADETLQAASERVLDLLVMTEDAPPPDGASASAASAKDAPPPDEASASAALPEPVFCVPGSRSHVLAFGFLEPFGEFPANPAVNFCMPNGPYGSDLCTGVPDRNYWFDFRRACYQHDMGYFWTPFPTRHRIDDQFFLDMKADCKTAHPWYSLRRYGCLAVAGSYYSAVRSRSGAFYTPHDIPGYTRHRVFNETLPVFRPFVLSGSGSTCIGQSGAYVSPVTATVARGSRLYGTGRVAAATRVVFDFVNPTTGQLVHRHVTNPSRRNCIVHHEPEAINTWLLPTGRIHVYAKYTRWETGEDVRVLVNQFDVV